MKYTENQEKALRVASKIEKLSESEIQRIAGFIEGFLARKEIETKQPA